MSAASKASRQVRTYQAPRPERGHGFSIAGAGSSQAGIHQIQNANLTAIAQDEVWLSGTLILPIRVRGGAGSLVRPVAFGVPRRA